MSNKKNNSAFIWGGCLVLAAAAAFGFGAMRPKTQSGELVREISPRVGQIQETISTTGTILPKNRLQIKPPVNGRVESIMVKEGDSVKRGQTLGWLSSTERAALLDAAQGQGEEKLKYWQEVYKAIALVSPIDGEVIVATIQPGQAVTTSEAALVLSDRLIVRAQVDETDIGKVRPGQAAVITLDAYPGEKIKAVVDHIYYESQTVNNVTIYNVDLKTELIPPYFRSGMNANVSFVVREKQDALLLQQEAVNTENGESYVLTKNGDSVDFVKRTVTVGLTQEKNVEIVSGLSADDTVIVKTRKYTAPKKSSLGKNPFMPQRRQQNTNNKKQGGAPPSR